METDNVDLLVACWSGNKEVVEGVLQKNPSLVNARNERQQTALYCAARNGHFEVLTALLRTPGVHVSATTPPHGGTALHGEFSLFMSLIQKLLVLVVLQLT
jgi:ankyrin repeat protein